LMIWLIFLPWISLAINRLLSNSNEVERIRIPFYAFILKPLANFVEQHTKKIKPTAPDLRVVDED